MRRRQKRRRWRLGSALDCVRAVLRRQAISEVTIAFSAFPTVRARFGWVLSAKLMNHRRFREQMAVPSKRVDRSILSFFHCLRREANLEVLAVNSHGGSSPPPRTTRSQSIRVGYAAPVEAASSALASRLRQRHANGCAVSSTSCECCAARGRQRGLVPRADPALRAFRPAAAKHKHPSP